MNAEKHEYGHEPCRRARSVRVAGAPMREEMTSRRRSRRRWIPVLTASVLAALVQPGVAKVTTAAGTCSATTLVVVAHADDDLLFTSPDIAGDMSGGRCLHTVFLTGGDAGLDSAYWSGREAGAKAAHAKMAGVANTWTQADIVVGAHTLATFRLDGAPNISVTFVRLPDGGINGDGFASTGGTSMQRLLEGRTDSLAPIDGSAPFTSADLTSTVAGLMSIDQPDTIRVQDPLGPYGDSDHSDHHAAARIAFAARQSYTTPSTLIAYRGYDIAGLPSNLSQADQSAKTQAFLTYAANDSRTCQTENMCAPLVEGAWLSRQYRVGVWTPTTTQLAPMAIATAPASAPFSTVVTMGDGGSSDPEGSPLAYSWRQVGGTAVTLTGADTPAPSFTAPSTAGVLSFSLAVSDGELSSAASTVTVSILPPGSNLALSASASASSENVSTGQTARKVIDGSADGYPGDYSREWATLGEGAGAWIQLTWTAPQTLTQVVLHDRPTTTEHITSATLTFSNGTTVPIGALNNDGSATTITFPATTTTSIKITVNTVDAGGVNIGLSEFEAYADSGTPPPPPVPTNVARSASASASSENVSTGQTARKTIDGSTDGYPGDYTREWATVGKGGGAWLQLTWTAPQTLIQVVLHDRPNAVEHITSATLAFSNGTTVPIGTLNNDGSATTITFPATTTTSIKITVNTVEAGARNIGLSEIEAYSDGTTTNPPPPPPTPNVAPSATATASSENMSTGQTARKVVDGSADGYPGDYSREWATLGQGAGAWVQLTWTAPQTLTQVVLHDRPNAVEHITAATLTFSNGTTVPIGALDNDGSATTFTFPATTTTSIRITINAVDAGGFNVGLSEIEAYTDGTTTPPPPPKPNVATSATATASSENVSTDQTARKVIDGSADGYPGVYSREWASVGEGAGAWVQLTWTAPQTLTQLVLHDRPNAVEHITAATLTFSNGTTVPIGALNNDGSATTITFPATTTTSITITVNTVDAGGLNVGLSEIEAYAG